MGALSGLKPTHVWKHFENICAIPHPSRHEEKVAAYITEQAGELGLEVDRDEVGNVLVRVPATPGRENDPIVVLQGHIDMVPVAAPGVTHNFETDGIEAYIDGDFVRARGTTLGADNGIGAAMMLAVMEDKNCEHGPLELLFTVNEESGMDGAHGLKSDFVKGRILINLDTEEWGEYYISCAGGGDSNITLKIERTPPESESETVRLKISGLKGGHSGIDINSGRGCANKIIARCLAAGTVAAPFQLISITGGNKRNSIADTAEALLSVKTASLPVFNSAVKDMADTILAEFEKTDPGLKIEIETQVENTTGWNPLTLKDTKKIIDMLIALPHGVITMSTEVAGLVETSTNLGVIELTETEFKATMLTRSAVTSHLPAVKFRIRTIAGLLGAEVEEPRGYPGWKPNMNSKILKTAMEVFRKLHGKDPEVKAIHAGLECGLFSEKLPGVDMLSIGPEMHNVHSPDEELYIPSVAPSYELVCEILKAVK